uniref:Uncharacterized protein n=1 Tax=Zea mays TaxID=4577 RepID=C4J4W5_MAIZE|nr:unknown [Zea mays]
MLRKSWNPVVKAPRHLAGAVSARYTGAAWLVKPMPKPSSMRPTMSIATLTAAALTAAPAKKSAPPASMTACLPIALVTRLATREAASPARYSRRGERREDVAVVDAVLVPPRRGHPAQHPREEGRQERLHRRHAPRDADVVAEDEAAGGRHEAGHDDREGHLAAVVDGRAISHGEATPGHACLCLPARSSAAGFTYYSSS